MRQPCTALCLMVALALPAAGAAIDERDIEPAGLPNTTYLEAVRGRWLQSEIVYLRPSTALPEGEITMEDAPGMPDPEATRRNWVIFLGVLLALVLVLVAVHGRGTSISLGSAARDPLRRRAVAAGAEPSPDLPPEAFFESVASMPDRRQALILLAARALERAAEANGQRLGRAQTARDVLRALPRRWAHFDALRGLIAEAEVVHFGGRDLPEERWRACLERARPLFGRGPVA